MTVSGLVRVRWLLTVLLIAGAALFAVGASAERHDDNDHDNDAAPAAETTTGEGTIAAEGSEAAEAAEAAGANTTEVDKSADEKVLGINLESTSLVVLAVIISLVLAVATWLSDNKPILLITAGFAAVFAAFDIAEFVHQIDRSAPGLAGLAVLAAIHAGTALLAAQRASADTTTVT